jgi:hypothetical protein
MEDDHVKKMAEMDQAIAQLKETLPAMTFSLYTAFKEEGFSDANALELIFDRKVVVQDDDSQL